MPRALRNALAALSLSTICFLSSWWILLNPQHYTYYFWRADPGLVEFEALGLDILLLAIVFWLSTLAVYRFRSPLMSNLFSCAWLLLLVIPINSVFFAYLDESALAWLTSGKWRLVAGVVTAPPFLFLLWRNGKKISRVALTLLLVFSPLVVINFGSALWIRARHEPPASQFLEKTAPLTPLKIASSSVRPQILWLVFDELDQKTTFTHRPETLKLPEFDRLSNQALRANNAYPPSNSTLLSLPALVTGQLLSDAVPIGANELELTQTAGEKDLWSVQPNIFSDAHNEGFSTGLVGWYHPYCRVLGASLDACSWVPVVDQVNPALNNLTLTRSMWKWFELTLYRVPFVFRLLENHYNTQRKRDHTQEFNELQSAAKLLLRTNLNLKMFHLPIPHHPWIYEANRHSFWTSAGNGYVDNLALADKTLGDVRRILEEDGRWDSSVVLVTSDHWWRESPLINGKRDHRIPFLLKLAGQKSGTEYNGPFNTILTRKLLMELLRGQLSKSDEVSAWLNRNTQLAESPFTSSLP